MTTVKKDVFLCELYSSCVVINDGDRRESFGRSVHVCLSNCPVGTKPYYLSRPEENDCISDSKYLISSFEEDSNSKEKAMSECYKRCKAAKDCYQFQVSWDYDVCELYTSCVLADYEEGDGGHVGTMRSIRRVTKSFQT